MNPVPVRSAKSPAPLLATARLAALLAVSLALAPAASAQAPLPPAKGPAVAKAAPAAAKEVPLPPPPVLRDGTVVAPSSTPTSAAPPERCASCHAAVSAKRFVHPSLLKNDCTACHRPAPAEKGKCKSRITTKWSLVKTEPDLCYGCHKRMDQSKSVHTAVRQGSCLSCHAAHSSNYPKLIILPREKLCLECHEVEPLLAKAVRHAPVAEGLCLDCHDAHGSANPNLIIATGTAGCQKCHDAKAPRGKGTPGAGYRVDLSKPVVHKVITQKNDCGACHEVGHSGDNLKLLKRGGLDLCYGCHERQDRAKHPHTAVIAGDCAVCHDPHSSEKPKLLATATPAGTCFTCHQDDLTGRAVIHKPLEKGCDQCHLSHGGPNRNLLKGGEGKKACQACHQTPVDGGKVKHAALERYGCTGCHDPHGTANRFLLPKRTNELCAGCHEGQKDGKHVSTILARGHTVGRPDLVDPRKPDRPFSCTSCHNPHGSDFPNFFYVGSTQMEACDGCHGDKTGKNPALKNIISRSKRPGVDPASGTAGGGSGGAGSGGAGSGGSGSGSGAGPGSGSGSGAGDALPPPR
jgi:predicted CXXCH cytochrome family protein